MLVILRILFSAGFLYCVVQARDNARNNLDAGDMTNAFWLACAVIVGIGAAATWAPYIGSRVAEPITGGMVNSSTAERRNLLLLAIRWLDKKKKAPWLVRWLCFVEGVRSPWLPGAFVIGMNHSRPGSWLEKVYAREVFKFNNAENCLKAYQALQRHGIDPRPHKNADVNTVLLSLDRSAAADPAKLAVPAAPPPTPPKRDPRIRIGTT
jgi:hypothetical protein